MKRTAIENDWQNLIFISGCVHREQEDISTAINLYLKSLRTMPQGGDSAFLSMVYNDLGDCYTDQNMEETARNMYRQLML